MNLIEKALWLLVFATLIFGIFYSLQAEDFGQIAAQDDIQWPYYKRSR